MRPTRNRLWWDKTLPTLRIPAGDSADADALLTDDGFAFATEDDDVLILEEES